MTPEEVRPGQRVTLPRGRGKVWTVQDIETRRWPNGETFALANLTDGQRVRAARVEHLRLADDEA